MAFDKKVAISFLLKTIEDNMKSCPEAQYEKAKVLLEQYENCLHSSEQTLFNEIFITLTGYSFEDLVQVAGTNKKHEGECA